MKQKQLLKIIAIIMPVIVIFGNYSITGISVGGLALNLYRVLIPLFFICFLACNIRSFSGLSLKPDTMEKKYYYLMVIWIIYGAASVVLFPYADLHGGLLELLALVMGAISVATICMLCRENTWDYLLYGIKLAVMIVCVIGIYEIITANHLSTSRFCDPEFIRLYKEVYGDKAAQGEWHVATAIFYNENDCSAILAILSAFFVVKRKNEKKWAKVVDTICVCLIFSILIFNNAFICYVAFLLALAVGLLFGMRGAVSRISLISSLIVTRGVVYVIEKAFGLQLGLGNTLLEEINHNANSMGSMYYRLNTYKVTLHETIFTSKGMGFGAGSFSNYFSQFVDSHMIMSNPHCFWFEILAEYGIAIFVLFVCFLVMIMTKLIIKYYKTRDNELILIIASGVALIIASVAPSSFLKYGYYWMLIGMAVFLSDHEPPYRNTDLLGRE